MPPRWLSSRIAGRQLPPHSVGVGWAYLPSFPKTQRPSIRIDHLIDIHQNHKSGDQLGMESYFCPSPITSSGSGTGGAGGSMVSAPVSCSFHCTQFPSCALKETTKSPVSQRPPVQEAPLRLEEKALRIQCQTSNLRSDGFVHHFVVGKPSRKRPTHRLICIFK